jgi:cyclophilin family peptidyl-prolyl cis-trans isomerase/HEAT repeat protein
MTALVARLTDPHPHVVINAAGALATFADSTTAAVLRDALEAATVGANVRVAIAQALGSIRGSIATRTLAGMATDSAQPVGVRATALLALVRAAPGAAAGIATGWAAADDWLVRLYAARALAGVSWTDAGRPLRTLATDDDGRVAAAALRAIIQLTDSASAPYPLFIQSLAAEDAGVRAAAASGMARRAAPADLPLLMQAYERAEGDPVNDAALAAVGALAALERRGVPVGRGFFLRFSPARDAEVRARVAREFGLDRWGDEPAPRGRELRFYEDVVRRLIVPGLGTGERPRVAIGTPHGSIEIELAAADAPLTVHNFLSLIERGYFAPADGGEPRFRWHRVVPNFVLQDGDPRGDGSGGPGYAIRDEINRLRYARGMVGMALSGPDTGGSQFFITHSPQPHLDGGYTIFGRVVAGMDAADRVVQDDPILSVEVIR